MGINFSRVLTLKYGPSVASYLREKRAVLSVGRVMTCVLGMVVRKEREIRDLCKDAVFPRPRHLPYAGAGRRPSRPNGVPSRARSIPGRRRSIRKTASGKKRTPKLWWLFFPNRPWRGRFFPWKKSGRRRMRRFYITWRSFRMTAQSSIKSVPMRR